jgi:hypothetical protein
MTRCLWLFVFILLSLGLTAHALTETKPVAVCEVTQNLARFDNLNVTLQGEYTVTSEVYLRSGACHSQVLVDGQRYVGGIALLGSDDSRRLKRPALFRTQDSAFKTLARAWEKARQQRKKLIVTLEGRIDSYPWFIAPRGQEHVRRGFGHLNSFPAQLVVKRLVEMRYE